MWFIYLVLFIPVSYFLFITVITWKRRGYVEGSLTLVMGKAGSCKSTYEGLLVKRALRQGRKAYTNYHVLGAINLQHSSLGMFDIQDSDIFIDEGSIHYDSRQFKSFSEANKFFFSHFRHFGNRVWILSQSFEDLDVKIRRQAQTMYITQPFFKGLVLLQKVKMKFGVSADETDIVTLYKTNILSYRIKLGFLAWKYFDSYNKPNLEKYDDNRLWGNAPISKLSIFKYKVKHKQLFKSEKVLSERFELLRLKKLIDDGVITFEESEIEFKQFQDDYSEIKK